MSLTNYELILIMIQNREIGIQVIEANTYKENVRQYKIYFNEIKYNLEQEGDITFFYKGITKMDKKELNKYQVERKLINLIDNAIKFDSIIYNMIKNEYKKKYGKDIVIDKFYNSISDKLQNI